MENNNTNTIANIVNKAAQQWVAYEDDYNVVTWYRTKRFGDQWGIVMVTNYEGEYQVDICISSLEEIVEYTHGLPENLPDISFMEEVKGKAGIKFLLWARKLIIDLKNNPPYREWIPEVIILSPSDSKRKQAYRYLQRDKFFWEEETEAYIWRR